MVRFLPIVSACRGLVLGALCLSALLLVPTAASGQPQGAQETSRLREFSVEIHGAPSCIDSRGFAELVVQRTKRGVVTPSRAAVHFAVAIDVAMDGASGTLTTTRARELPSSPEQGKPDATRTVRAATCREVADALALIAAVILDPEAAVNAARSAPSASGAVPPRAATPQNVPEDAPQDTTAAEAPASEWRVSPGIAALFSGGVGPGISTGFDVFFGVAEMQSAGIFALDARVSFAMTQTSSITTSAGTADFNWWAVGLTICPIRIPPGMLAGVFAVAPCAGFEGGLLKGEGHDTVSPSTSTGTWFAASVGLRAALWIADFLRVEVGGDLVIPLRRDRFFFGPDVTAYRVPAVAGRGTVGVALLF